MLLLTAPLIREHQLLAIKLAHKPTRRGNIFVSYGKKPTFKNTNKEVRICVIYIIAIGRRKECNYL